MKKPVYAKENTLFSIALVISLLCWAGLVFATSGFILLFIPVVFLAYLFAQSGLISYLKGTGALVSDKQFLDIHERVKDCAQKIGLNMQPRVYILHGNGVFNAFATKFLRKTYIILLSDILDSLEDDQEAINFYIGHEMGHLDRNHLFYQPILAFGLIFPLLGAAYSRAREYTCDLYGAACCSPEAAQKALVLLSVGAKRYKTTNMDAFLAQTQETSGFWMSFHELVSSYPWLIKRVARISPNFKADRMPKRNIFAYIPAMFVPRLDITSIVIIYLAIAAVGIGEGISQGQEFIEKAENAEQIFDDEFSNRMPAANEALSTDQILDSMVTEINKDGAQNVDEVTILNKATKENGDTLVYHFTLTSPDPVNIEALKETVWPGIYDYWCGDNQNAQFVAGYGIKADYRYFDQNNALIGDVILDTTTCK